jgi:hypothetical protein
MRPDKFGIWGRGFVRPVMLIFASWCGFRRAENSGSRHLFLEAPLDLIAIGIDFGGGGAYAFRQLKKEPGGVWPRRKLKSVRIRAAIVRPHQAVSIAERTARVPRIVRPSRATAGMRSVLLARQWGRRDKRSGFQINDLGGGFTPVQRVTPSLQMPPAFIRRVARHLIHPGFVRISDGWWPTCS